MAGLLAFFKNMFVWRATTGYLRKYDARLSYIRDPRLVYEAPKTAEKAPKK